MDLIQQYNSDVDTGSENEENEVGEVRQESKYQEQEIENVKKAENDVENYKQQKNLPPLPTIQIYLQQYEQNMSFKKYSTYCFLPWNPSLSETKTIRDICESVIKRYPQLSNNYKFIQPHLDRTRDVKQHITIANNVIIDVEKADYIVASMARRFSKVVIPNKMIHEVGGGTSPISAVLNKKRNVIRFRLQDYLKLRMSGQKIFLCADLKKMIEPQIQYCSLLNQVFNDVILENGYELPEANIRYLGYHTSLSIGYLKNTSLSDTEIDNLNNEIRKLKFKELEDIQVNTDEVDLLVPDRKSGVTVFKHKLL